MNWVAVSGYAVAALVAVGAWLHAIRMAGKREELEAKLTATRALVTTNDTTLNRESVARHNLEQQLQQTSREFQDAKNRHADQLREVRQDVANLETDLAKCIAPGARRARLNRLLEKLSPRGATPPPTPGGGTGAEK